MTTPPIPPGRPIGDGILVLPDDAPRTTSAGIAIPEGVLMRPKTGTVVAVGPNVPADITIGTRLLWIYDIPLEGRILGKYILLNPDDVGLILENEDAPSHN